MMAAPDPARYHGLGEQIRKSAQSHRRRARHSAPANSDRQAASVTARSASPAARPCTAVNVMIAATAVGPTATTQGGGEQRVGGRCAQRGVEPDGRRQAGHVPVSQAIGNEDRRGGHSRHNVTARLAQRVGPQLIR